MLAKKSWIPILCIVLGMIGCGLFYLNISKFDAETNEVSYSVDIDEIPTMPCLKFYINMYVSDEVKAFLRTTSPEAAKARVREIAITMHYRAYPDCREYDAVLKDAKRQAAWYVKYKAWEKKEKAADKEWWQISTENHDFFENFYENMSAEERSQFLKNISDADRTSLITKLKDWRKRSDAARKKLQKLRQKEPIEPKPTHTHDKVYPFHFLLN